MTFEEEYLKHCSYVCLVYLIALNTQGKHTAVLNPFNSSRGWKHDLWFLQLFYFNIVNNYIL